MDKSSIIWSTAFIVSTTAKHEKMAAESDKENNWLDS